MKYLIFLLLLLTMSCSKSLTNKHLATALDYAGDNKDELKQVLAHYSNYTKDSLKYKAAVYLIENMPYRYSSVTTPSIERL